LNHTKILGDKEMTTRKLWQMIGIFILLIATNANGKSQAGADQFFARAAGFWYGEVQNIYKIWWDASDFRSNQPWSLLTVKVRIEEHDEIFSYELELSKNSAISAPGDVYFLSAKNLLNGETKFYTLGGFLGERQGAAFWRYDKSQYGPTQLISASALKIGFDGPELLFGLIQGQTYCVEESKPSLCVSDFYTPFFLRKVAS